MNPAENTSTAPPDSLEALTQTTTPQGFSRFERFCLAVLLVIFTAFTWRSLLMYYSGDDMMNTYWAWTWNHKALIWANLLVWKPIYRPLGEVIYLIFYAAFGFQPIPLYIFSWLLLLLNVYAVYAMFRSLFPAASEALTALSMILVHGAYIELYSSAGTIFDHLWFLFTVLGVTVYVRTRQSGPHIPFPRFALLWLLCVLAMDSKESGVTLPVLFACYECIFVFPKAWRATTTGRWLRAIGPLYAVLAATCIAFVFGRVLRTPETEIGAYHPQASITVWLQNLANYFDLLVYRHGAFTVGTVAVALLLMASGAILLRNRIMLFGLLWFLATITPVALIVPRQGYVLYVPVVGLGLYFAEILAATVRKLHGHTAGQGSVIGYAAFACVTAGTTWWHAANWPGFPPKEKSPVFRLAEQFRREYPSLERGGRILFASDAFGPEVWDVTFILRLLYHDKLLDVKRLKGNPDQQPQKNQTRPFVRVFAQGPERYEELDSRNVDDSIRLHILRDYSVGSAMAMSHRDHGAYVVSGIKDFDSQDKGRWTEPTAVLKFKVYPGDSELVLNYWVAEVIAVPPAKTLTVRVNQNVVGSAPLTKDGENQVRFPVKSSQISRTGFTLVELSVDKPYKSAEGDELGVILFGAGFEYPVSR